MFRRKAKYAHRLRKRMTFKTKLWFSRHTEMEIKDRFGKELLFIKKNAMCVVKLDHKWSIAAHNTLASKIYKEYLHMNQKQTKCIPKPYAVALDIHHLVC